MFDLADFLNRSMRVMSVFSRPKEKEFMKMATVTGIGMVIIGAAGLVVAVVFNIIK